MCHSRLHNCISSAASDVYKNQELCGFQPRAELIQSFPLDATCTIAPALSAKNLGFYFDCKLNLDTQLDNVSKICYINLRNIGRIGRHLTKELKIQLVHSTIFSILDNGNATYGGLTSGQLNRLQKIQNAAVRFIFGLHGKRCREHISPYLKELHFLPVFYRIRYKIALLVFKCLNNEGTKYLSELIKPNQGLRQCVRKNDDCFLLMTPPRPNYTRTNGAFTYTAPAVWNNLPYGIRCMSERNKFKTALKTHYFRKAFKDSETAYNDVLLLV